MQTYLCRATTMVVVHTEVAVQAQSEQHAVQLVSAGGDKMFEAKVKDVRSFDNGGTPLKLEAETWERTEVSNVECLGPKSS